MSKIVAFLDSCILYPYSVRDVLIQFSVDGLFQAKWSSQVREEVIRNVEANIPKVKGKMGRTFELMELAVPDFEAVPSVESIELVANSATDSSDKEILAAAISVGCTHLVTANLKDFDIGFALANGVFVIHPDEFLKSLIQSEPEIAKEAFRKILNRCKNPPITKSQYLDALRVNRLNKTADKLLNI